MSKLEVVKFGSDLVSNVNGVDRSRIEYHANRLAEKRKLIVVTSGAVATGRAIFRMNGGQELEETLENQKYLAGLGCTAVFHAFEEAFRSHGRLVASYPITHQDLEQNQNLLEAIEANIQRDTVVIFNEADAYSQRELMELRTGGDNDGLALHVALVAGAEVLTIVTEHGGVVDDEKKLIEVVRLETAQSVQQMVDERPLSKNGRGGIKTKTAACIQAMQSGIEACITDEYGQRTTRFVLG